MRSISFLFSRFSVVLWIAITGLAGVCAQENIVELPPFLVDESVQGPRWRYAQTPEFEILSRASDDTTREIARSYHQLHHTLELVLPARFQVKLEVQKTLILYDAALLPATAEEMLADAPPPGSPQGTPPDQPLGILRNPRFNDLDTMVVFASLPGAGAQDSSQQSRGGGSNPVRSVSLHSRSMALTPSYVAYLMGARVPALPSWFVTGFLSVYQKMKFSDEAVTLPGMEWPSGTALLPMVEFLAGPNENAQHTQVWLAQTELFYRWAMSTTGESRRENYWKFLERAAWGRPDETMFKEWFGLGFSGADEQLGDFLKTSVRKSISWRSPEPARKPPVSIRDATGGEIARIKGDWERLASDYVRANSPGLEKRYLGNTRRTLRRAYDQGDRDPRLLAILGLLEYDAGNTTDARGYLEEAVKGGVVKPRAYLELARLRFAEFQHQPAGGEGKLSAEQVAQVLAPLSVARRQSPPLAEVYELIADVWTKCATAPQRMDLAPLEEGVAFFPQRVELLYRTAALYSVNGFTGEAAKLAETAARNVPDEASRTRFAEFKTKSGKN